VIVGGGFGGLRLARRLGTAPVSITLIDQHNYHTFMPLLYEVATAGLSPGDIAQPFRALLRSTPNVAFVMGRVERVDTQEQVVVSDAGDLPYDFLILASGTTTNTFGIKGASKYAFGLKDMPDATSIRNGILRSFERATVTREAAEQSRLMTVVVVGGGPTGVELAGALAELRQHVLRRDFPALDMSLARMILLEAGEYLLPSFPDRLRRKALEHLGALGVDTRLRSAVKEVDEGGVSLKGGLRIESANVIWVAGTRGSPLATSLGVPLSRDGRIPVTETLVVPGVHGVLALGDIAYLTGPDGQPYPMLAQTALQQADVVADNIVRALSGATLLRLRYHDRGIMATIGRRRAVALIKRLQFNGTLAWGLWLAVHLLAIIGLRNRVLVLLNWTWNYVRYDRANRLITDDEDAILAKRQAGQAEGNRSR
jgi:NADH dehydrogenase